MVVYTKLLINEVEYFTTSIKLNKSISDYNGTSNITITINNYNGEYANTFNLNDTIELYKSIGDTLKNRYIDHTIWILTGDLQAAKYIGLKPSRKIQLYNGQLECKYLKFEIYSGSRKELKINN